MPAKAASLGQWARSAGPWIVGVGMTVAVALLLLYLSGLFHAKVTVEPRAASALPDAKTVPVRRIKQPRYETAVGTVRPVHEAAISSKLLARVVEVTIKAGQPVQDGEVLVRLDDAQLQARHKQAEAKLQQAQADQTRAQTEFERAKQLRAQNALSQAEYDRAEAAFKSASAEVSRGQQAVREAEILLGYATIRSPLSGTVIDKRVEAGDTASPGQILLTLYDPGRMQLVATVRESLALRLKPGDQLPVHLETINYRCEAAISEIVPEAQAASRSFTVKVTGPCPPGVYSGMFGRLMIPVEDEELTVVPVAAVRRVGQLTLVDVLHDSHLQRRSVQVGRQIDSDLEVLSGLREGERVVLHEARVSQEPAP